MHLGSCILLLLPCLGQHYNLDRVNSTDTISPAIACPSNITRMIKLPTKIQTTYIHLTMKQSELRTQLQIIEAYIVAFSDKERSIYDPYLGSSSHSLRRMFGPIRNKINVQLKIVVDDLSM